MWLVIARDRANGAKHVVSSHERSWEAHLEAEMHELEAKAEGLFAEQFSVIERSEDDDFED